MRILKNVIDIKTLLLSGRFGLPVAYSFKYLFALPIASYKFCKLNSKFNFQIVLVGVQGEVSVQKDIYKTVEVLKAKIKQDKKGKINIQYMLFLPYLCDK